LEKSAALEAFHKGQRSLAAAREGLGTFHLVFLKYVFSLSFAASDAKLVEPSVDVANKVLVRNIRFASEKLAQKA
jgi:hypothetical protein